MSVKINGLEFWKGILISKRNRLKLYKKNFENHIRLDLHRIGEFIAAEARRQLTPNGGGLDTGTLRSRVDYKVEKWDHMELGIYEDSDHPPTANVSKYTGKVRTSSERYAWKVHEYHDTKAGFLQDQIDLYRTKMISDSIVQFNEDYFKDF